MGRSEPTLVPEWLKNAGSSNLHPVDQTFSKLTRNRLLVNSNGHDFGESFNTDKTTSSYFRRSSRSNGSPRLRSWDEDAYDSRKRDRSIAADFSNASKNSMSKLERNGFRHFDSMVSADVLHKNAVTNSRTNDNPTGGVKSKIFQKDFPSLVAKESAYVHKVARIPSPVLSSVIQSLPTGSSTSVDCEKWTSALAEVPVLVGSNGSVSSAQQVASLSSTLNVGTRRLEELAIKNSKQLIPVTPSTPKALVLKSLDKQKFKLRGPVKVDVSKSSSNTGKLHVLKPMKESLSPRSVAPDHKAATTVLEKRPTSQAVSRNEFFNSLRKKSTMNACTADNLETGTAISTSLSEMDDVRVSDTSQTGYEKDNGDSCDDKKHFSNGKKDLSSDLIISEEEEAAFLRSLGWEEDADEGGLTEDEINAFLKDVNKYIDLKPSPFNSCIGAIFAGSCSSDAKLES